MTRGHDQASPTLAAVIQILDSLSDTPLVPENSSWWSGTVRDQMILQTRLSAMIPDAGPVAQTEQLLAWASQRLGLTIVYWRADRELEITLDKDIEQAMRVIRQDIIPAGDPRHGQAIRRSAGPQDRGGEYAGRMSEPVVTRVIAVQELPWGSPASRRVIAEWSDGSQSEALSWYAEEWLVSEGDLVGRSRAQIRTLAHQRNAQSLRDDPGKPGTQYPFFGP